MGIHYWSRKSGVAAHGPCFSSLGFHISAMNPNQCFMEKAENMRPSIKRLTSKVKNISVNPQDKYDSRKESNWINWFSSNFFNGANIHGPKPKTKHKHGDWGKNNHLFRNTKCSRWSSKSPVTMADPEHHKANYSQHHGNHHFLSSAEILRVLVIFTNSTILNPVSWSQWGNAIYLFT